MDNSWTLETEDLLERIRQNSIALAEAHRRKYHDLSTWHKWFRIPTITMGIVSSSLASRPFGASEKQSETGILILGCLISILSAIELYLNIHASMDLENKMSKDFYNLGVDIFKTLRLSRDERPDKGADYLVKKYNDYVKLKEASPLNGKLKHDLLARLPSTHNPATYTDDSIVQIDQQDIYTTLAKSASFVLHQVKKSEETV